MSPVTLIVGIGSGHGDDQAGWLVADHLAKTNRGDVVVRKSASPVSLLNWLDGVNWLTICDGCRGLGEPGRVQRWDWPSKELNSLGWSGTHDMSLPVVLQLACQLGSLPKCVTIWGVEGADATALAGVSSAVETAIPKLVAAICREISHVPLQPKSLAE